MGNMIVTFAPIPPRVQISKNRYGYRTELTFDYLEKISNGVFK